MRWGRLSMDPPVKPEDDNVKFLIGMTISEIDYRAAAAPSVPTFMLVVQFALCN